MLFRYLLIVEHSPIYAALMLWRVTMLLHLIRVVEHLATIFTLLSNLGDMLSHSSACTADVTMML
jgi:hypothetical protein